VEKLYDELDFQRAVQVYLWSNIMASFGAIRDEYRRRGASSFDALLYEQSAVPAQLVLTANNDTPYISGAMDLNEGPIVMEVPAGLVGPIDNIWQQPIVDVGGPFGPDRMQGGKFLILPPDYEGEVPEGYFAANCCLVSASHSKNPDRFQGTGRPYADPAYLSPCRSRRAPEDKDNRDGKYAYQLSAQRRVRLLGKPGPLH